MVLHKVTLHKVGASDFVWVHPARDSPYTFAMFDVAIVTLMVSDIEKACVFYRDVLGMEVQGDYSPHWVQLQGPGVIIGLHPGGTAGDKSDSISVGLMVGDFDGVLSQLQSRGVEFDRVTRDERASSAYFKDPDGYWLYIMHRV